MAAYILDKVPPKAVILHRDIHIMPSSCLAGRISLVAYNGWMWSHGYNYHERDKDRTYAIENALKDSDPQAYQSMRRWGVRYVLGEWLAKHTRPSQQQYEDALARHAVDPSTVIPPFDRDSFLDGQLKRIHTVGRYELLEVQGYGFPVRILEFRFASAIVVSSHAPPHPPSSYSTANIKTFVRVAGAV